MEDSLATGHRPRSSEATSDRSARTGTAPAAESAASLSARRDSARTSQPAARSSRNRWPPRKPLPPVRKTLAMAAPLWTRAR